MHTNKIRNCWLNPTGHGLARARGRSVEHQLSISISSSSSSMVNAQTIILLLFLRCRRRRRCPTAEQREDFLLVLIQTTVGELRQQRSLLCLLEKLRKFGKHIV